MPATTLVCPHCEKTVEIQVSSVTRSRPCPNCGEMVMLQMAEKTTKTKRRALLMSQNEPPTTSTTLPPPVSRDEDPSQEPQPLPGDAFERMRADPEIQRFRQRLVVGAGVVLAFIVGLVLWNVLAPATPPEKRAAAANGEAADGAATKKPEEPMLSAMTTPEELQPQVNSGNLVFRPPGSVSLKSATALPATPSAPIGNLAKLAAAEEVLTKFLQAPTWKDRMLLVRNKLRVAKEMSTYYALNADGPQTFDSIVEARELSPKFTEHVVVFEGGGRRTATVEHTSAGPLVDWESFVGAGEMAWSEFMELKQATPTLFRVLVSPAGHFENSFGNPSQLNCYSLRNISEPGAKVVYGYVDKRSEIAKEIDVRLQQSEDATVPMILRLKFPPDAPVDFQVWIHQFMQSGWVTP